MLTLLEVFTPRVVTTPLVATDGPESMDPIQILDIQGLGPVNADVSTQSYASLDGEFYSGSHVGKRNIVITIRLNPDWSSQSYESLRAYLYQYFMPKNKVTLQFTSSHMEQVWIDGYVETCEPNIFTKDPIFTVSIICPQPAFTATSVKTIQGVTVASSDPTTTPIPYTGTNDTGFSLDILVNAADLAGSDIRIVNTTLAPKTFLLSALAGSTTFTSLLELVTTQGSKHVEYKNVNGDEYNAQSLLKYVSPGSIWLQLENGSNLLRVVSSVIGARWVLTYQARYGGI